MQLNEANSQLYGKIYEIPESIINKIRVALNNYSTNRNGVKRAKFLLNNKKCTYQTMKRLKNFFDYPDRIPTQEEFHLAGGEDMMNWVNLTLQRERDAVRAGKQAKQTLDPVLNIGTLKVQKDNPIAVNEDDEIAQENKSAIVICITPESKLLLVKRSAESGWMQNKWAFVGGVVKNGENPEDAARREVKEEIGIEINRLIEKFTITRGDTTEIVYYTIVPAQPEIKLNKEHTQHGFFTLQEIEKMGDSVVPNLIDYVSLVLFNKEYTGSIYDKSQSEQPVENGKEESTFE